MITEKNKGFGSTVGRNFGVDDGGGGHSLSLGLGLRESEVGIPMEFYSQRGEG